MKFQFYTSSIKIAIKRAQQDGVTPFQFYTSSIKIR